MSLSMSRAENVPSSEPKESRVERRSQHFLFFGSTARYGSSAYPSSPVPKSQDNPSLISVSSLLHPLALSPSFLPLIPDRLACPF